MVSSKSSARPQRSRIAHEGEERDRQQQLIAGDAVDALRQRLQ